MSWTSYSEYQVIQILQLADTGLKPVDICGRYGIPVTVFRSWQARYGGPASARSDQRLEELELENGRLRRQVEELGTEVQRLRRQTAEG